MRRAGNDEFEDLGEGHDLSIAQRKGSVGELGSKSVEKQSKANSAHELFFKAKTKDGPNQPSPKVSALGEGAGLSSKLTTIISALVAEAVATNCKKDPETQNKVSDETPNG